MMRKWLVMLVGTITGAVAEAACPSGATVTYLANEAFAISGRAGTVLIDALFRNGIEPYPTPSDGTKTALESAAAPFGRVVWVLVSHRHADHYSPQAIAAHLHANPRARVASTLAVISALRDLLLAEFADRLLIVEPPARGSTLVVERAGLRIEAYALSHGEGTDVDNLGFLVELDGTTILHMGDSEASSDELAETGIAKREIDIALVPYWYVYGDRWIGALDQLTGLKAVGLMHLPASADEATLRTLYARRPTYEALTEPGQHLCAKQSTKTP